MNHLKARNLICKKVNADLHKKNCDSCKQCFRLCTEMNIYLKPIYFLSLILGKCIEVQNNYNIHVKSSIILAF